MIRKILSTLLCLALAAPVAAQNYYGNNNGSRTPTSFFNEEHNLYYGLRLGLGLAHVSSDDSQLDGSSMQAGLNVGGIIGIQLSSAAPVYLESGLFYTEKGGKGYNIDENTLSRGDKFTYDLNYLEIPIIVKYLFELDYDITIQPFFGGYFAYGISGSMKDYLHINKESAFSDKYFKRFDGGLRLGCGIQYQVLYGELAYDWGLSNISHAWFQSSHTGCLSINVGVNF